MMKRALLFLSPLLVSVGVWSAANFSRVTEWTDGDTLTASDLNAEFDNILNNGTPQGWDDYSATTLQMRSLADPYPGFVESQATSLAGELERLRYQILAIKQAIQTSSTTYWYQDAPSAGVFTIEGSTVLGATVSVNGNFALTGTFNGPTNFAISTITAPSGYDRLSVTTTTYFTQSVHVSSPVYISSHTEVTGDLDVGGDLEVIGSTITTAKVIISSMVTENGERLYSRNTMWESGEYEFSVNTSTYVAHGFGRVPKLFFVILRCKSADVGYSAGDEVAWPVTSQANEYTYFNAAMTYANATNIGISFSSRLALASKTSGTPTLIDETKWRVVFRAWD